MDEVLTLFAAGHPEKAELVKLRYFVGMTLSEAADALGVSTATAERYWRFAGPGSPAPSALPDCRKDSLPGIRDGTQGRATGTIGNDDV